MKKMMVAILSLMGVLASVDASAAHVTVTREYNHHRHHHMHYFHHHHHHHRFYR
ncbi:MAG: hypothetical protein V4525_06165 [Pseudomonadota bacterium]